MSRETQYKYAPFLILPPGFYNVWLPAPANVRVRIPGGIKPESCADDGNMSYKSFAAHTTSCGCAGSPALLTRARELVGRHGAGVAKPEEGQRAANHSNGF